VLTIHYNANSRLHIVELPNNTRRVYCYGSAGRLATVCQEHTSTGNLIVEHLYQYDALDRIEKETVLPEPAAFTVPVALMTYDADDRLDTFNGLQCLSDLDGNLVTGPLSGNLASFTFNARNRLTAVGNATFVYDSEGRRMVKTENGTTTTYVHDPQSALSRLLVATTGLRVPHHDYRGSTVALSNATGELIGRVVYGTYGEVVSRTGDTDTRFLYNGAYGVETDANGLCLMRARYYSPETRRFLNADPIQFGGGNNWQAFCFGDPAGFIDPFGLESHLVFDTRGYKGRYGHVAVITKDIITGEYTRYDHAWGVHGNESLYDVNKLLRKPGSDIAIVIPDDGTSDVLLDKARERHRPKPGASTADNNCMTNICEVLDNAGIERPNPLITTPINFLNEYLDDEDYVRRAITEEGRKYMDERYGKPKP